MLLSSVWQHWRILAVRYSSIRQLGWVFLAASYCWFESAFWHFHALRWVHKVNGKARQPKRRYTDSYRMCQLSKCMFAWVSVCVCILPAKQGSRREVALCIVCSHSVCVCLCVSLRRKTMGKAHLLSTRQTWLTLATSHWLWHWLCFSPATCCSFLC